MANQDYSQYVSAAAKKYGIPEKLINQVISVESSGNPMAISKTGPRGLMQVSSAVAKEAGYSKDEMFDPAKNIDAGAKYLAQNLKAFNGNVSHALLGYNQGTGGAKNMLSGKTEMAAEGWKYIHNKKFSPEYLSKDAAIQVTPNPEDYMTPSTENLIGLGREGVNPDQGDKYSTSAMFTATPDQAKPQEPEETEAQKRVKQSQQLLDLSSKINNLFSPAGKQQLQVQAPQPQPMLMQQQPPQQLDMSLYNSRLPIPQTVVQQPKLMGGFI